MKSLLRSATRRQDGGDGASLGGSFANDSPTQPPQTLPRWKTMSNDEVYETLQKEHSHIMQPHDEVDCAEWELLHGVPNFLGSAEQQQLDDHLALRIRQSEVVNLLLVNKVHQNYTRFVEAMAKIQEVRECSESTTAICESGKQHMRQLKTDLVQRGLQVTQLHRRKRNLERTKHYALQIQRVLQHQEKVQSILREGRHAEAVLLIVKGVEMAHQYKDVCHLTVIKEILQSWEMERGRVSTQHLDRILTESCKRFDPAKMEVALRAYSAMGQEVESGTRLFNKWKSTIELVALTNVRKYAVNPSNKEKLQNAEYRDVVRHVKPKDAAIAHLELTCGLAHCLWNINAMEKWLASKGEWVSWHGKVSASRPQLWDLIQGKESGFLAGANLLSIESVKDFVSIFNGYQIFQDLACEFFPHGILKNQENVQKLVTTYLSDTFHKKTFEFLRLSILHEAWGLLNRQQSNSMFDELQSPLINQAKVRVISRKAQAFLECDDPADNPFRVVLLSQGFDSVKFDDDSSEGQPATRGIKHPPPLPTVSCYQVATNIMTYIELTEIFPHAAEYLVHAMADIAAYYLYVVCANMGATSKETYYPEQDKELPVPLQHDLEELHAMVVKALPKEYQEGQGEVRQFQPPQLKNPSIRNKLHSPQDCFAFSERVAAMESVQFVLTLIEDAVPSLETRLPPAKIANIKKLFGKLNGIVKMMYKVTLKRLSLLLLVLEHYTKIIPDNKWEPKSLEAEPSPYVTTITKDIRNFYDRFSQSDMKNKIPKEVFLLLWKCIAENLWSTLVEGFSKVRKCNNEGRALMSLDLQTLQHALRALPGVGSLPGPDFVEDYIKTFYLGGEEYIDWVRNNHARYTAKQMIAVVNINSGIIDKKRKERSELVKRVEEELLRLDHRDRGPLDAL